MNELWLPVVGHEGQYEVSERDFRVPSRYPRCRRTCCPRPPVADMARWRHNSRDPALSGVTWWAYCADHLRSYNYEVSGGRVWWLGTPDPGQEGDQ